jgi:predicted transcriptional regulator
VKDEAELQGEPQKKKLKEAGDDLIRHLGEDSPAAEEINKQVEEVDSVRQKFMDDIGDKIEKVKGNPLYSTDCRHSPYNFASKG